ncbi:hypothetical protein OJ252_906 [Cryptosporidium canis]|uniref:U3 small nucleolar RNA-associated protein 20 N-terminal domain-containing protein n=1 Tax=Cryptosporidium canis TaxID=195482 RepID=A0ABQ8P9Q7_9CRYT|nr:hypothetical protein OJ252_906 [Cryptosporidium canis]
MDHESASPDEALLHTDEATLIEWCCRLLMQIRFSDASRYPRLLSYQVQVLYWLIQISLELEGSPQQLVFLRKEEPVQQFCGRPGNAVFDLPVSKGQIQRINYLISVLETILRDADLQSSETQERPEVLETLLEKFLLECTPGLLSINHMELQMGLVNILCDHGRDSASLAKYKSMFQGLISGSSGEGQTQSLRSNLLQFSLSSEGDRVVRREDRSRVIPVVIRILLSKLGKDKEGPNRSNSFVRSSKKGNKALSSSVKRKVIISYLSELPREEISQLLSVIIDPLVSVRVSLSGSHVSRPGQSAPDPWGVLDILSKVCSRPERDSEVELKGYYKSLLLDRIISGSSIHELSTSWVWEEARSPEDGSQSDFGFVFRDCHQELSPSGLPSARSDHEVPVLPGPPIQPHVPHSE